MFGLPRPTITISWERFFSLLQPIDDRIHSSLASNAISPLWTAVSELGNAESLLIVTALTAIVLLWKRRRPLALWLASGYLLGHGTNHLFKLLTHRARPVPYDANTPFLGFSFPSGHAAGTWIFVLLAWTVANETITARPLRRLLKLVLFLLATGIALSRITLGVHWTSDVIAGIVFAGLWVWGWKKVTPPTPS